MRSSHGLSVFFFFSILSVMSKRRELELLAELVEYIKHGKINSASAMLESDKDKKLGKYCDEVSNFSRMWSLLLFIYHYYL